MNEKNLHEQTDQFFRSLNLRSSRDLWGDCLSDRRYLIDRGALVSKGDVLIEKTEIKSKASGNLMCSVHLPCMLQVARGFDEAISAKQHS